MVPGFLENMSSECVKGHNSWDVHKKPITCRNYVGKNPS